MEEKETKENKMGKWIAMVIALIVVAITFSFMAWIFSLPFYSVNKNESEEMIEQGDDRKIMLQEMYQENSMDIVIKANALIMSCRKMQFIRDVYKDMDIEAIEAYLEKYDLNESSDLSDERFDLEVDTFIYIFRDELVLDNALNELLKRREFLEKEMRETEEN